MENEIVKTSETSLANFGGRDPIKEMALRIRTMMPNASRLADSEAMAVAQLAYAHDLDPFNGEVWGIGTGSSWKGIMVGIKGLRKAAKREARAENSTYWFDAPKLVDAKKYGCDKPGAIAYEMVLRDTATTQAWSRAIHDLTSAGIPYPEAVAMMGGSAPVVIGIGIADPGEPSKMALHARAKKRGEAEALKIRYSLEFRGASVTVEDGPVDGETSDLPQIEQERVEYQPPAPKNARPAADVIDELFPVDIPSEAVAQPAPRPEPAEQSAAIDLSTQQHRHVALFARVQKAGILNQTTLEVWKRCANDTAESIAEKCDLMELALSEASG